MDIYKRGSRGEGVRLLQKALSTAGYAVIPDGIYGIITEEAVKAYQKDNGLRPDGIAGPATLGKLLASKISNKKSKRRIDEIIIHCTATPEGKQMSIDEIRRGHRQRGFSDIGYHYVVMLDGSVQNGRDVDLIGAHALNHNAHSIGVSYVGGLENSPGVPYDKLKAKDTRNEKQKKALVDLLKVLRLNFPKANIIGHRDTSPDKNGNGLIEPSEWIKMCPCFDAIKEYKDI